MFGFGEKNKASLKLKHQKRKIELAASVCFLFFQDKKKKT